ncbi:cytochrome C oxidase subunit II [Cohnella sp. REN36]|uniref:cytochrome C oxidase subunit II n=1 Tax=Cohnella sp. REN36 TaxID=2887347 RepID=UPI001D142232|nr:cytochrome C oxidase subunit II [Cohnella sp. REN36]MCC3373915.1 cytochrome C oxidase subunit II [Cohnella sp. REN36]
MYKWIMPVLLVVACLFGVYLLATGLPERPKDESSELAAGQELLKIVATSTDFKFDQAEYHVKAGTNYKIKFSNKSGKHGAHIEGANIDLNENNPTVEYTFPESDKGKTFELKCSIMCGQGHATMASKIIVD